MLPAEERGLFILDILFWQFLLQIFLIALNAFFACAEIAIISSNDTKIEILKSKGDKSASKLLNLKQNPSRFLATIQISITLSGFLGSAFAADNFAEKLVYIFAKNDIAIPRSVAVIVITLILSYLTLVFGELVPKQAAMKNPEKNALRMSAAISGISTVFSPIVWLLTKSVRGVLRLMRIDPDASEESVTEEEIIMMANVGLKEGTIDEDESVLIQNVFAFDDLTVGEICVHRNELAVLWTEENLDEWEKTIHQSRHTIYPVCENSIDNVVGIVNSKDFFALKNLPEIDIKQRVVKPPYFIHESMKADTLFSQMKKHAHHFALVIDEYGGLCGIITVTDLVEQLVGDFDSDEQIPEEAKIERLDSKSWKILGSCPIHLVENALGAELEGSEDCDTFSGFIIGKLGEILKITLNFKWKFQTSQ